MSDAMARYEFVEYGSGMTEMGRKLAQGAVPMILLPKNLAKANDAATEPIEYPSYVPYAISRMAEIPEPVRKQRRKKTTRHYRVNWHV